MAWYWPLSKLWGGKAAAAKADGRAESSAAKSDLTHARKSVSSIVNNTAGSAQDDTKATGHSIEATAEGIPDAVEQAAENTMHNPVTAVDAKVEKLKHKRPGMSSHESVGDKFKHAFKIDHKQHHTQQTNESALVSGA
ncbi:hypothetical protein H2198_005519 [Neophaeococcomyces mojaviensis]|uniref:Uncharacterized protein n=1 Tax=Neophaeococcomyces mojaviensis TaxID=3383035 RepID=A0ACC3A5N5_9EURO|nr:hypothetical protein H2198_005519 [Knufia sp. JES_112]